MHFPSSSRLALLASASSVALAQTFTDCNPTKKSCPSAPGLSDDSYKVDFTQGEPKGKASWTPAAGTTIEYGDDGAVFTIGKMGQAPTLSTDFFIFFG
jgi:hypothetical protein